MVTLSANFSTVNLSSAKCASSTGNHQTHTDNLEQRIWREIRKLALSASANREDPVAVTGAHNETFSAFAKVPNEILLEILGLLEDDIPSMFCIRQVNRRFRGLVDSKAFRDHPMSTYHDCQVCDGTDITCSQLPKLHKTCLMSKVNSAISPDFEICNEIWSHIGRDRRCDSCLQLMEKWAQKMQPSPGALRHRKWNGAWTLDKFTHGQVFNDEGEKLDSVSNDCVHCSGCIEDHRRGLFTQEELAKDYRERVCIARQGYVRLCEHKTISLEDIEGFIQDIDRLLRQENYLEKVEQVLFTECQHPSHQFGCSEGKSEYPRAFVSFDAEESRASLFLEWMAHSGPTALRNPAPQATTGGQSCGGGFPASVMRDIAKRFRNNAGKYIVPSESMDHSPEMECFKPSKGCKCVSFQSNDQSCHGPSYFSACEAKHAYPTHIRSENAYSNINTPQVQITFCQGTSIADDCNKGAHVPYDSQGLSELPCVQVRYTYKIEGLKLGRDWDDPEICENITVTNQQWLHAMDRSSYKWDGGLGLAGTCTDPNCTNYYVPAGKQCYETVSNPCTRSCPYYNAFEPAERIDWEIDWEIW